MTLNRKLHELRGKKPMYFIAFKSGLNPETLRSMECRGNVSVPALYWYCKLFNANADELLDNKVDKRVTYYKTGKKPYKKVTVNGRQLMEHRAIMAKILGRDILPDEVVHHKDGNKLNNSPENLTVIKKSDHSKIHCAGLIARRRPVAQMDKNGNVLKVWECAHVLSTLNFDASNIAKACNGKQKTAYGYTWKYL